MNAGEFASRLQSLAQADPELAAAARELIGLLQQVSSVALADLYPLIAKALVPMIKAAKKKADSERKEAETRRKQIETEQRAAAKKAADEARRIEKERADAQKREEKEREAAEKKASDEAKRLEKERKAAEKKAIAEERARERDAAAQARAAAADPAQVEAGYRGYCEIRDNIAALSIAEIRTRFEPLRRLGKPALEAVARQLQYGFKGSARKIAEELLNTLEGFKVNQISTQSIEER